MCCLNVLCIFLVCVFYACLRVFLCVCVCVCVCVCETVGDVTSVTWSPIFLGTIK